MHARSSADSPASERCERALHLHWVTSPDEFCALEKHWDDLLQRSQVESPFLTFAWMWTWWQHFGGGHQLRIALIHGETGLAAIVPLMLSRREGLRRLSFISSEITDYKDFIVDPAANRHAVLRRLFESLDELGGWDVLQWSGLRENSPNFAALGAALAAYPARRSALRQSGVAPCIAVQTDWETYWQSLGANFRGSVKRRANRLRRECAEVAVRMNADPAELDAWIDRLAALHVAHWKQARGQYSLFEDSGMVRFFKALARCFSARGWLRLPSLSIDGEAAALQLAFEYAGRVYYFIPAYDARHARFSPGTLLLCATLRDGFERGLREFDLLAGDEPYKFSFEPRRLQLHGGAFFASGVRGRLARSWLLALRPHLEQLRASRLSGVYFWYRARLRRRG